MKNPLLISTILLFMLEGAGFAASPRVSTVILDLSKVYPISISPGRVVKIEFPCPILKQPTVGLPKHFAASIAQDSPNQVDIHSLQAGAATTNLIVQCGKNIIVMDLIPDNANNRDFIRVSGLINGPILEL